MLKYSRYWFTQLTLIHALCLWALPDERDTSIPGRAPGKSVFADCQDPEETRTVRRRHRGTGPAATVARWLTMAGIRCAPADQHAADKPGQDQLHPFVAEAGDLAALALECGSPVRFIWIDESGIVRKVGSVPQALVTIASTTSGSRRHPVGARWTAARNSLLPTSSSC